MGESLVWEKERAPWIMMGLETFTIKQTPSDNIRSC
jgi:uncharacterized Fe-S cluster protein YjdI